VREKIKMKRCASRARERGDDDKGSSQDWKFTTDSIRRDDENEAAEEAALRCSLFRAGRGPIKLPRGSEECGGDDALMSRPDGAEIAVLHVGVEIEGCGLMLS